MRGPTTTAVTLDSVANLTDAVRVLRGRRILVLTGAGVSTDSGIPDYRGPDSPPRTPMMYAEFRSGEPARQRYWARSHLGWRTLGRATPNDGHRAIAALETDGHAFAVITQNVDGLHQRAGSRSVVDLHGRISDVRCLDCGDLSSRRDLRARLDALNPGFGTDVEIETAPDGDAVFEAVHGFRIADCRACGGVLKPDVVFFGENVPKPKVERCYTLVEAADAVLVAGSSLTVLSGFRFARHAASRSIPVVIVNRGPTRADDLATVRVDAGCSQTLSRLAGALRETGAHATGPGVRMAGPTGAVDAVG
ncbi:MAG: NAD-dependent protein deacetylase [Propionibacteriales bacterium]|nr:NAD-dependent protein deacetylase [Propionibacteriales bacterium]